MSDKTEGKISRHRLNISIGEQIEKLVKERDSLQSSYDQLKRENEKLRQAAEIGLSYVKRVNNWEQNGATAGKRHQVVIEEALSDKGQVNEFKGH